MPAQYQSDPMVATKPMPVQNQPAGGQQTPVPNSYQNMIGYFPSSIQDMQNQHNAGGGIPPIGGNGTTNTNTLDSNAVMAGNYYNRQQNALQQTPGGLYGNINANRYSQSNNANTAGRYSVSSSGGIGARGGDPTTNANATQWNSNYSVGNNQSNHQIGNHQSNFTPVGTGVDNFQSYTDNAYAAAMRQMQPQMQAQQRSIEQSLVSRGLQPGSAAYNSELDRMTRGQNDMFQSAAFGAQNAGLQAQNQAFAQGMQNNQFGLAQNNQNFNQDLQTGQFNIAQNTANQQQDLNQANFGLTQNQQNYAQQFGYDQLANQLAQSRIGANATMSAAAASAGAARYAAEMRNQLGMSQLNENARQYDIGNILATNGQNQQFMLGMGNLYNNMQNTGISQFGAQQGANNNWYNQNAGFISNAPGINFTPNTGYTNSQIQGNQNYVGAIGADNQMGAGFLGGLMTSDKRLKENIVKVGRENGINIYEFEYKDKRFGSGRYRGVMAQEIEGKYPDAVVEWGGFKSVNYNKLPVNMERVA